MENWAAGVKHLTRYASELTRTYYDDLKMSLQQECQFVQHVIPSVGTLFAPLEVALREEFLPDPFGGRREEVTEPLRRWIN